MGLIVNHSESEEQLATGSSVVLDGDLTLAGSTALTLSAGSSLVVSDPPARRKIMTRADFEKMIAGDEAERMRQYAGLQDMGLSAGDADQLSSAAALAGMGLSADAAERMRQMFEPMVASAVSAEKMARMFEPVAWRNSELMRQMAAPIGLNLAESMRQMLEPISAGYTESMRQAFSPHFASITASIEATNQDFASIAPQHYLAGLAGDETAITAARWHATSALRDDAALFSITSMLGESDRAAALHNLTGLGLGNEARQRSYADVLRYGGAWVWPEPEPERRPVQAAALPTEREVVQAAAALWHKVLEQALTTGVATREQVVKWMLQQERGSQQPPDWAMIEVIALDYERTGHNYDNQKFFANKYRIGRSTLARYLEIYEAATGRKIRPGPGRAKQRTKR